MCGIFGFVMESGVNRSQEALDVIRLITTEVAVNSQKRGDDATGIALFDKDGNYSVVKGPYPAVEFVNTDSFIESLLSINNNTTILLGHTRAKTQGSEEDNNNNHPIITENVIGVHNGTIINDDELEKEYGLTRKGEVDSEVPFLLLSEMCNPRSSEKELKEVLNELEGSFALAWVDLRDTTQLHLARNTNPCELVYIPSLKMILFASERLFIINALTSIHKDMMKEIRWITLPAYTGRIYDTDLNNLLEFKIDTIRARTTYYYDYEYGYGRSYSSYGGYTSYNPISYSDKKFTRSQLEGIYKKGIQNGFELGLKEAFARFQKEFGFCPEENDIVLVDDVLDLFSHDYVQKAVSEFIRDSDKDDKDKEAKVTKVVNTTN